MSLLKQAIDKVGPEEPCAACDENAFAAIVEAWHEVNSRLSQSAVIAGQVSDEIFVQKRRLGYRPSRDMTPVKRFAAIRCCDPERPNFSDMPIH